MRFINSRAGKPALVGLAGAGLLLLHMLLLASSMPVQRNLHIHLADWPAQTPPLRIALLSDLHVAAPSDTPAKLARVVAQVNAFQPDLVMIAGDVLSTGSLTTRTYGMKESVAPLAGLRARLGTLAVLGNHDMETIPDLSRAMTNVGITLLRDEPIRRGPLTILGVETEHTIQIRKLTQAGQKAGGIALAMMHIPDGIPMLPGSVRLVVAGHTHCGQIALPLLGPLATASRTRRRYACGLVREGQRLSIVTAGLGTSNLPLRLGASPDYWAITLSR